MVSYKEAEPLNNKNFVKSIAHKELKRRAELGYQPSIQTDDLKELASAIKKNPNNPELHYNLAVENHHLAYMSNEIDYHYLDQAIGGLLKAIELSKTKEQEVKYRKELAGIYKHGYGDTLNEWNGVLELDTNDVETNRDLAMWFKHYGPVEEAISYLEKLVELEPENPGNLRELADILLYKEIFDPKRAEAYAKKAVKLDLEQKNSEFNISESYELLGYTYAHQQKRKEAKFAFNMGLKFFPDNATCFSGLLQTLYRLGEFKEIDKKCAQGITLKSSSIKDLSYLFLGIMNVDKGKSQDGRENFENISESTNILKWVHKDFVEIYAREMNAV